MSTTELTQTPDPVAGVPLVADVEPEKERHVCIICSKGTLDMAYPGLIMANAARMSGIKATLFFTFWGLDIITDKTVDNLHVPTVGNPSMHIPTMVGGLPGMESMATKMMKKQMEDLDIPDVRELVEILHDSGAKIYACRMAMDMFKRTEDDLVDQVDEIITAMDFYDKAAGSEVIFI